MSRMTRAISACLVALALAACAAAPAAQPPAAAPTSAPTAEPAAAAPASIQITDALGRQVSLPAAAQRIVSLAPSVTETLFAVGAGPQVVGDTSYCDYPPDADALPEIGGFSAKTISVESIVALSPDLVIGGSAAQAPVAEALAAVGIPTLIFEPKTFEDVYSNIQQIGYVTGHVADAEAVVTTMRERVAKVEATVAGIPAEQRPTVFYEVFDEPLMSAGPGTFIGQMIGLTGAASIFADATEDYPQVSAEAVIDRDPAVILGPSSHGDKLTAEQVAARPGWENIGAVRAGRIYLIDGNMVSRAGPRLADALEAMAAALYPEQPK
ncbi:cobalamin-binding protein [Oscillochloris sp. ZM17-4]|uniref:ABC transporter substrate-binding protein n=1 Tax=Oscillochloris sp. ZM17-4 TaxID=2866714 RepID=UPI001C731E85|nr:cobalamin-binding protein [Oscillochloris sp. ZM17-4]MBX0328241.1 cobalamin-binding protein [Oscillochloris sp. ZM17-4]